MTKRLPWGETVAEWAAGERWLFLMIELVETDDPERIAAIEKQLRVKQDHAALHLLCAHRGMSTEQTDAVFREPTSEKLKRIRAELKDPRQRRFFGLEPVN